MATRVPLALGPGSSRGAATKSLWCRVLAGWRRARLRAILSRPPWPSCHAARRFVRDSSSWPRRGRRHGATYKEKGPGVSSRPLVTLPIRHRVYSALIGIVVSFAAGIFGIVIWITPFLKVAVTFVESTGTGSRTFREKAP